MMGYQFLFPVLLMLYEFSVYMSNDMYAPAFPLIATDFGVDQDMVQLTLVFWMLGAALSQVILGPLCDRFGKRPVLFWGGAIFLLSCLGCTYGPTIETVIFSRFFQGIGVCSMMIAGYASIHETFKDQQALRILSIMGMVSVSAPMIGPLIGGYLLQMTEWRTLFKLIFGAALLALIGLYQVMPRDLTLNPSALNLRVILKNYAQLLLNKKFMSHACSFGLFYSGLMLWIAASPFILMTEFGLTSFEFGLYQIPVFGAFMLGSQIMRLFGERFSLKRFIGLGIVFAIFGGIFLFLIGYQFPNSPHLMVLGTSCFSLGFGLAAAPLNRLSFTSADGDKGVIASVFYTCMMTTGAFWTALFGIIPGLQSFKFGMALILLAFILLILARFREQPSRFWKLS